MASGTKDPEIAEWLKTPPVLGAHTPIHIQRREHDAFIDPDPPPVGQVEHLGLKDHTARSWPASTIRPKRCPARPAR